jgi:hypothetical protein
MIFGPNNSYQQPIMDRLNTEYDFKVLSNAHVILGIKSQRTNNGLWIYQTGYINNILKHFNFQNTHHISTPLDHNNFLIKDTLEDQIENTKYYQQMIGSLKYLVIGT